MQKISTVKTKGKKILKGQLTIGLDLGDRSSCYCVLDENGEIIREQKIPTTGRNAASIREDGSESHSDGDRNAFSLGEPSVDGAFATDCQPSNPFHLSGGRMQVNFSIAWRTTAKIVNDIVSLLPNIILGLLIFVLFLVAAAIASSLTRRFVQRRRSHQGMVLLLARLVHTSIVVVGFLIAISVVAPSFQTADLIKLLGIGTVAIGFAFQNILQNFLAGILLLLQEPFQLGDLISVTGIEGNVSDIQARATIVTTKEGRNVFIPNAIIFTNPVAIAHNEPTKSSPG